MVWTDFMTCIQVKEKVVRKTDCIYVCAAYTAYATV